MADKLLVQVVIEGEKGGSGSGNWGHRGRAGKLGGSTPKGGGGGELPSNTGLPTIAELRSRFEEIKKAESTSKEPPPASEFLNAPETKAITMEYKAVTKGLKLPGAGTFDAENGSYRWEKKGGFADKQLNAAHESAQANGWKAGNTTAIGSGGGEVVGAGHTYTKNGWALDINKRFGVTSSSNRFSITVKKI